MKDKIKVVVFDFDGVLVDSEGVKRQLLKDNFIEFGETFAQNIFNYQQETGSNRYDVADYAAHMLGKDKNWADEYVSKYTETVFNKIVHMSNMNTCESTLLNLVKKYPLYISTATPTKEINRILVSKTMKHMFRDVFGSPDKKINHFLEITKRENINYDEILFIGDAESDAKVAETLGLDFLAINYRGNNKDVLEIDILWDIVGYLEKNEKMHTKFCH